MTNGEIQAKPNGKRISHIKKGIQRTLSTAAFETIVIHDYIEEDIEWENLQERQTKLENWETILLQNFKRFHDLALRELGLEQKCAYTEDKLARKARNGGKQTALDGLLENLDDLDAVDVDEEVK